MKKLTNISIQRIIARTYSPNVLSNSSYSHIRLFRTFCTAVDAMLTVFENSDDLNKDVRTLKQTFVGLKDEFADRIVVDHDEYELSEFVSKELFELIIDLSVVNELIIDTECD